jgi:hypothetical protein
MFIELVIYLINKYQNTILIYFLLSDPLPAIKTNTLVLTLCMDYHYIKKIYYYFSEK